jgi:dipeptidyl aminopeptidase/acylaminoacyl peptidase
MVSFTKQHCGAKPSECTGHGQEWNEQISKDWATAMDDYLLQLMMWLKESYADKARLGAVGASYGGYLRFI